MSAFPYRLGVLPLLLLLAACGSTPEQPSSGSRSEAKAGGSVRMVPGKRGGGYYKDDGPADWVPENLDQIPDAEPRWEPLHKWANRPYVVLGKEYVPQTQVRPFRQEGIASWYGKKFHGQKTSTGESYDMFAMSAAHPTLPLPSYVRVTNPANGKAVVLRVNDRGPFHAERIIDLSYTAAHKLGYVSQGSSRVIVESIVPGEIGNTTYAAVTPPPRSAEAPRNSEDMDTMFRRLLEEERESPPAALPTRGIFLQLGAFASAENAENLKNHLTRDLDWLSDPIQIHRAGNIHRLHLGPYPSRAEAERMAQRIRVALGYAPTIVTR